MFVQTQKHRQSKGGKAKYASAKDAEEDMSRHDANVKQ
jgi:hypothetical protein